ncbi:hypothetical protein M9Y10_040957 [Tritrichomonas musculus]|uniref:Minichromosome loss protein Mcl1 middle region domain-containing protein n=1 Tax=Tritrichomonas musculus TaxID=1915356 RepID=A0ABR2K3S5_9EUKA
MNIIHSLSFSSWPFPGPKNDFNNCKLSMSKFGMLAYSSDNIITIFAEELDRYTPMLMWKPFGDSSTSKNSRITAIGWYDASCCFEISLPVIVIASGSGNLIVYDIRSTKVIANFKRKNDYITAIKWSPFSTSTFFAGTSSGSFIKFEVDLAQIVTSVVRWEIMFSEMQIDFITIDEVDGNRAAVASKSGHFGVIYNVNTDKPFHSNESLILCEESKQITNCSFFPIHRNFLIVATDSESMLYALEEGVSVPLLNIPDIQQIQISRNLGNRAIVVRFGTVELWELQKDMSKRISSTKISSSKLSSINEIQLIDILDDTIVLLTSTFWLTTIELRRDKLFVTKRVKLFNSRPNDFSFANDAFAFCTEDGRVLVTRTTSPKFKMLMRWNQPKTTTPSPNRQTNNNKKPEEEQNEQIESPTPEENPIKIESESDKDQEVEIEEEKGVNQQNIQRVSESLDSQNLRQRIRRHMTLDTFGLNKKFNLLNESDSTNGTDDSNSNDQSGNITDNDLKPVARKSYLKKAGGRRRGKTTRRFSISEIDFSTRSAGSLKIQKTFDPLPENDELVSKSVVIRRGSFKQRPSFLDEANEDGSYKNVTTQLSDGAGSFEQPSDGLVLGTKSSLLSSPTKSNSPQSQSKTTPPDLPKQTTTNQQKGPTPPLPPSAATPKATEKTNNNNNNNSKRVKIQMPISKLQAKRRRLSSSIEEVNMASNLIHFAKRTKLATLKDASFSFDPSVTSRDTSSIPHPYTNQIIVGSQDKPTEDNENDINKENKENIVSDLPFKETVKEQIRTVKTQNMYGNNCSFLWSYQVANSEYNQEKTPSSMMPIDKKLNRIEWITGTRLIAWNQDKDSLITSLSDPNLDSYSNQNTNNQSNADRPVKSIVTLKSRQGVVYVIDLKLHKVEPLLKKPGMSISNVVISKNKQLFAVIVNGFIVSIFISSNKQGPWLLGTITFYSDVVVTFINDMVVMINIKSHTMTVTSPIDVRKPVLINGGKRKLKIKSSYGIITCANGSSKGIFIGTSLGFILKVEAVTYNVVEIYQMSSAILQFRWTSASSKDSSFLACDLNGSALMLNDDGEYVKIKGRYSNSIPISPAVIAGVPQPSQSSQSSPNNNNNNDSENESDNVDDGNLTEHFFIESVSVVGGVFKPKFPTVAARNPLMKPRATWAQILSREEPTAKDLPLYGIPLIAKLIDAERNPNYSVQQTLLLRDLILNTPQLWHRAFRYSLLIKDNESAKNILSSMPSNHPEFMKCLLKRALFGSASNNLAFLANSGPIPNSNSNSSLNANYINRDDNSDISESLESVQAAANMMEQNGFIKDAVDILLIAGLWVNACKLLVKKKLIHNAVSIARIYAEKNNLNDQVYQPSNSLYMRKQENESNLVIKELADIIMSKNLMPSYAAIILCEAGFIDDVIAMLQEAGESEQARILTITE